MSSPSALKELASALVCPTWIQSQSRRLWLGHASTSWQQLLGATRTSFYLLPRDASAPMKLEGEVASKAQLQDSRSSGFSSKVTLQSLVTGTQQQLNEGDNDAAEVLRFSASCSSARCDPSRLDMYARSFEKTSGKRLTIVPGFQPESSLKAERRSRPKGFSFEPLEPRLGRRPENGARHG